MMTVASAPLVLLDIEQPMATLTLNRPARHNALDQCLADTLLAVLRELEGQPDVRCVLLRAAGRSFGVGGDLATFTGGPPGAERGRQLLDTLHAAVRVIARSDKLYVCAAQGAVAGGSLGLALSCDYWLWADDARLTPAYAKLAATPDCGLTWTLARALGPRRALQWLLDGTTWSASRAMVEGLGYGVALQGSLDAAARDLAERLAQLSPHAVRGTKRLMAGAGTRDLEAQLDQEASEFLACSVTEPFREQVDAFARDGRPR